MPILGVYDRFGYIDISTLSELSTEIVSLGAANSLVDLVDHLFEKDVFFNSITHALVIVADIEAMSFLSTGMLKLRSGQLDGLFVVCIRPLPESLREGLSVPNHKYPASSSATDRFIVADSFSRSEVEDWLSLRG